MKKSVPFKTILAFFCVYVLWGSTYLAIRFAIETLPPLLMAGVRFLTAGSILYAYARLKENIKPEPEHWKSAFWVGGLLLLGGNGMVVWAQQWVPSGITALIIATVPLWTVILEWLWFKKKRPGIWVLTGIFLGMAGLWGLLDPFSHKSSIRPSGILALLTAALVWSLGSIEARRVKKPSSSFLTTGMELIAGGSLLFTTAILSGSWRGVHLDAISMKSMMALFYLIFFGALVGFTSYKYMLKVASPVLSSTYAYVNPVIAVFLGWAFAGESLNGRIFAGAAIILTGVCLITIFESLNNKKPSEMETPA